jgi:hypothetical protein
MLELKTGEWQLPGGSLRGAIELLESLHWYLSYKESDGRIVLFRGDRPIFSADSRDALDAFVCGAALAYRSLPEPIFNQFREYMDSIPGERHLFPGLTPL